MGANMFLTLPSSSSLPPSPQVKTVALAGSPSPHLHSCLLRGVLVWGGPSHRAMPTSLQRPRVLLMTCPLQYWRESSAAVLRAAIDQVRTGSQYETGGMQGGHMEGSQAVDKRTHSAADMRPCARVLSLLVIFVCT